MCAAQDLQGLEFDIGWSNPLKRAKFPSEACLFSPPSLYYVLMWGQIIVQQDGEGVGVCLLAESCSV